MRRVDKADNVCGTICVCGSLCVAHFVWCVVHWQCMVCGTTECCGEEEQSVRRVDKADNGSIVR